MRAAVLLIAALGACTIHPRAEHGADGAPILGVRLVDSVVYEDEAMGAGALARVEVRTAAGTDTLPDVLTAEAPLVLGDSAVLGFRYEQDAIAGAFRYQPGRPVMHQQLPADFVEYSEPAFSPDGRHLAYLAQDPTGMGAAVVVSWPEGRTVYRGPGVAMLETDAGVDRISWPDATRFEIQIALSHEVGGSLRVRGTVGGAVRVDTVAAAAVPPPQSTPTMGDRGAPAADVRVACDSAAAVAERVLPRVRVRVVADTVLATDHESLPARRGCVMAAEGHGQVPGNIFWSGIPGAAWRIFQPADGPDGMSFGLWQPDVICRVVAGWDGGMDDDPTYVPSDAYTVEVTCAPATPDDAPSADEWFAPAGES